MDDENRCTYRFKRGICKDMRCSGRLVKDDNFCNFHNHPIFLYQDLMEILTNGLGDDVHEIAEFIRIHPERFKDYESDYNPEDDDETLVSTYLSQMGKERAVNDHI